MLVSKAIPSIHLGLYLDRGVYSTLGIGLLRRYFSTSLTAVAFDEPYGSMSMGTLSDVIIQISTMSALVTAMQPSVQSWLA